MTPHQPELKLCPFCGSDNLDRDMKNDGCECLNCGCYMHLSKWNDRTPDPEKEELLRDKARLDWLERENNRSILTSGRQSLYPMFLSPEAISIRQAIDHAIAANKEIVRWCRTCGSIVIDLEFDGRTKPGEIMRLKSPLIATSPPPPPEL